MTTPWRRRRPVVASLVVGSGAYVFFATTLMVLGGAEPEQAWGLSTVAGAAVVGFVAWAVFTRTGEEGTLFSRGRHRRGERDPDAPDGPSEPTDGSTEEPPDTSR